jgi:hypothetical protein
MKHCAIKEMKRQIALSPKRWVLKSPTSTLDPVCTLEADAQDRMESFLPQADQLQSLSCLSESLLKKVRRLRMDLARAREGTTRDIDGELSIRGSHGMHNRGQCVARTTW